MSTQPPGEIPRDQTYVAATPVRPPGAPLQQPPRPQLPPGAPQGQPRPFIPGGPVAPGPRGPPPRPSGPNSFAPQLPQRPPLPQGQSFQGLTPQGQPLPGPQYQGQPPQQFQGQPPQQFQGQPPQQFQGQPPQGAPIRRPGPPPPQQQQQNPNLEKQNSFQGQRSPAPPLGANSRQGSLASLGSSPLPDSPGGPRRMESEGTPPAVVKNRSYSIAGPPGMAPPGMPMHDEERRRSISALGGRPEETQSRGPGLAFIKEGVPSFDKKESPLNVGLTRLSKEDINRGSKESVRSDSSDRPESRLSGSRMTDSIMGSLDVDERKNGSPYGKKQDDDDDVVIQNNSIKHPVQNGTPNKSPSPYSMQENGHKVSASPIPPTDRSPSLSRTNSSPDQKPNTQAKVDSPNRPQSVTSTGAKTPAESIKADSRPSSIVSNKSDPRVETPEPDAVNGRPASRANVKPTDFGTPIKSAGSEEKKAVTRKAMSAPRTRREGDNDSGVDESTQGNDHVNGSPGSPNKKSPSKIPGLKAGDKTLAGVGKPTISRSPSKSAANTPHTPNTPDALEKKIPMNKVQVGAAPSPNIKAVKSKIGSLENATHKPGGGKVRIENRKVDFKAGPRIAAKNDTYVPGGGDKKITQKKLQWNAKSKIGSLENATHKPGGGDKKIESIKLDFKDKAKPKVASTVNITHKPGGGDVKSSSNTKEGKKDIENQKLEIKAQSKVGSLDNVKHKPGGGDIKIFDDKDYLKQIAAVATDTAHSVTSEDCYDYMSLQSLHASRRESVGPRSIMSAAIGSLRNSSQRPQRPRTAREPSARSRHLSPRKCQTPRLDCSIIERPPFRIY